MQNIFFFRRQLADIAFPEFPAYVQPMVPTKLKL
jgi:hypothetical protein